ncbi:MAG: SDR family oxidoreductase [Steroidobacteraceae bacterium]
MQRRSWVAAVIGTAAVWATLGTATLVAPEAVAKPRGVVVVAGATGRTGREVVAELVRRKHSVRAMVRDAAKAQGMFPAGVEIVVADVRDPAALAAALKGATYVISTIGASGGPGATPDAGPEQIDNQGVANLAGAAKRARIKHFVLVSSAAVTKAADYPMAFMRPILGAKLKGENALRASGVPYTVIRPGGLLDEPGGAKAVQFSQGDTTTGRIPRADVALVCVEALGRREAQRKTFEILSGSGTPPQDFKRDFAALERDPK